MFEVSLTIFSGLLMCITNKQNYGAVTILFGSVSNKSDSQYFILTKWGAPMLFLFSGFQWTSTEALEIALAVWLLIGMACWTIGALLVATNPRLYTASTAASSLVFLGAAF